MEGQPIMITVETCLPLVLGTFCELLIAYFLEQLCSCYFPFLLSAKYYFVIKIRWPRTILISTQITRSSGGKTAFEDRNKLPLIGCIYCIIVFPWIFLEILISLLFLFFAILKSELVYSPFMTELKSFEEMLFLNKYFLLLMVGMPVLYRLDYSLGLRRWQKRQSR